jgi:ABC-type sugar transport system permease subunit
MYLRTKRFTPYLFILPMLLIIAFIYGYSLIRVFDFSMRRVRGISGVFIGLSNYRFLLKDPIFKQAITNNVKLFIIIPVLVFLALIFAILLFENLKGTRFYRVALFLPYILAIPVVGIIFSYMFTLNGVVNDILKRLHLKFFVIDWLGDPKFALWTLMIIITWKELGFGIALFLARLMSLDRNLYDSASIDGANWWQKMFYITVPQLRTIIEFFIIITIINMLSWVFSYAYTITMGGPGWSTIVMELYIYNKLARSQIPNPGAASSASVVLFMITLLLIGLSFRLRKRIERE